MNFLILIHSQPLLLKRVLHFNVTLFSFSVRKILLKYFSEWLNTCLNVKVKKNVLLFLCARIIIFTYHVPMQVHSLLAISVYVSKSE